MCIRDRDFGVPQNRERIYIVGLNKEYYNISDDYEFKFPSPTYEKTRLGDILEHDVDEKYTISDALWEGHQRRKKEHKKKGNGFGYSLFNEESEYTNTISARYYNCLLYTSYLVSHIITSSWVYSIFIISHVYTWINT